MRYITNAWLMGLLAASLVGCTQHVDSNAAEEDLGEGAESTDNPAKADSVTPTANWTFMYYGAGDNSLAADILKNINELESVGSTDQVNLVAFYDSPNEAFRSRLQQDSDLAVIGSEREDLGKVNSSLPETLVDFASWAMRKYPAERYALVISSHGEGALRQTALDDSSHDAMALTKLGPAIDEIQTKSGHRLEFLGIDACLMQTVEVAYQFKDTLDFLVASENYEKGAGWDFPRLATALSGAPGESGASLASDVVAGFAERFATTDELTLSVVNTADTVAVADDLSALARALRSYMERSQENFDLAEGVLQDAYRADGFYADLINLAQSLQKSVPDQKVASAAKAAETSARAAIRESFVSKNIVDTEFGLSIFVPLYLEEAKFTPYQATSFAAASEWDEFVGWWLKVPAS